VPAEFRGDVSNSWKFPAHKFPTIGKHDLRLRWRGVAGILRGFFERKNCAAMAAE
jgi:hypothetical protein